MKTVKQIERGGRRLPRPPTPMENGHQKATRREQTQCQTSVQTSAKQVTGWRCNGTGKESKPLQTSQHVRRLPGWNVFAVRSPLWAEPTSCHSPLGCTPSPVSPAAHPPAHTFFRTGYPLPASHFMPLSTPFRRHPHPVNSIGGTYRQAGLLVPKQRIIPGAECAGLSPTQVPQPGTPSNTTASTCEFHRCFKKKKSHLRYIRAVPS